MAITPEDLKMGAFDRETQLHIFDQMTSKVAATVPCGMGSGDFNEELYLNSNVKLDFKPTVRLPWLSMSFRGLNKKGTSFASFAVIVLLVVWWSIDQLQGLLPMLFVQCLRQLSPFFIPRILINMASRHMSINMDSRCGPNHAAVTSSATGAHSIGDATRMIQFGDSDVTVAGSTESSIDALSIAGFFRSRTLTTNTILHH
ncbi:hypothetical protein SLEP1_g39520 [Rubroshorea leprosula]|uniref:beta-ketoacyl-[acyl-carrier-protein] synthase I n=1 Tax=Rubroshorea leprosula TaxID=152421 RepID=A0AAV5L0U9_9ROSI|nr:hypothetical protein SLEP1_g39520 [Rubroshorea leprosula]